MREIKFKEKSMKKTNLVKFSCFLFFCLLICLPAAAQDEKMKLFGDVDVNGVVNILDALKTAQYSVGMYPQDFDANPADVDWDYDVDIVDALIIARYAVGSLDIFKADEVYNDFQAQLDKASELWNGLGMDYYEFIQVRYCFCMNGGVPFAVQVKDDVVVSVVNTSNGEVVPENQWSMFLTIDGLFGQVQTAINVKHLIMDLQFDAVYHYPSDVSIDHIRMAVDDEMAWSNYDLRALRRSEITSLPGADLQNDPFALEGAVITGDILSTSLTYSGGCVEHLYTLYAENSFMESYPVQINCYLTHDGMDDMCDAIVGDNPVFDLSPIMDMYESMYHARDTILINLYGYFSDEPGKVIWLEYNPVKEAQ
jgi:hypothetical protein